MKMYYGTLKKDKETSLYYIFDLVRGEQITIHSDQQSVFNDDLIGNGFKYVIWDRFEEALVIITEPHLITHSSNLEYHFSLRPNEIEALEALKEAVKFIYENVGSYSVHFTPDIEFGRLVYVRFNHINVIKDITDRSNPLIS
jgi:hypothetical protein